MKQTGWAMASTLRLTLYRMLREPGVNKYKSWRHGTVALERPYERRAQKLDAAQRLGAPPVFMFSKCIMTTAVAFKERVLLILCVCTRGHSLLEPIDYAMCIAQMWIHIQSVSTKRGSLHDIAAKCRRKGRSTVLEASDTRQHPRQFVLLRFVPSKSI